MAEMNKYTLEKKPLYVALAQRKDQRVMALQKEWQDRGKRSQAARGRGRGMGGRPQMKPNVYPQGFNPMYGRGFTQPQMPYVQPSMRGGSGWGMQNRPAHTPMIPGNFPPRQQVGYPMNMAQPMPAMANQNRRAQPPPQRNANPQAVPRAAPPAQQAAQQRPARAATEPRHGGDINTPLTSEMLSSANPSQQKQMIGERIFPKIQHREPKLAGKITGMLLEMDNTELLHLLEDETALMAKINEALAVLNSHASTEAESLKPGME